MPLAADANVGFTLTPEGKARLIRVLEAIADALPKASAILTDRAGRIAEVARKPPGIDLEALAALAAGCNATTSELALALGDQDFSLLFEHDDDQQVFVWPVADRALLVILLRSSSWGEKLEDLVAGKLGIELSAVLKEARDPLQAVPPPRINPQDIPHALSERMRILTVRIMELRSKREKDFTTEVNAQILRAREELIQAMNRQDWDRARKSCEDTLKWVNATFK